MDVVAHSRFRPTLPPDYPSRVAHRRLTPAGGRQIAVTEDLWGNTGTVAAGILNGHPAARLSQRPKSELGIEPVSVPCPQKKDAEALKIWMVENGSHHGL